MVYKLQEYDPSVYDSLGDIVPVSRIITNEDICRVGEIILKYGYEDQLACLLAHRHFDLLPNEFMLERMYDDVNIAKPYPREEMTTTPTYPNIIALGSDRLWYPVNYSFGNLEINAWNDHEFLSKVADCLIKNNLQDKILLSDRYKYLQFGRNVNTVERNFDKTRTSEIRAATNNDIIEDGIPTTYTFNIEDNGFALKNIDAQCATNTSDAKLDIIMLVDISSAMGAAKLNQISLSFSSEFAKFNIGQNTRVALITFTDVYNIVGDLKNFTNSNQLSTALLGLKVANSTSVETLPISLIKASDLLCSAAAENSHRSPAILLLTSTLNEVYVSDMLYIVQYELSNYTRITVNYNVSDANLASVLEEVASPANNFTNNDKNLYTEIQNALLQATCNNNTLYYITPNENEKIGKSKIDNKKLNRNTPRRRQRILPENCQMRKKNFPFKQSR